VGRADLFFRRPIPDDWEGVAAATPAGWGGRGARAVARCGDSGSVALRTTQGFSHLPGDGEIDGVAGTAGSVRRGDLFVRFEPSLDAEAVA
jgi:hypothetical protein